MSEPSRDSLPPTLPPWIGLDQSLTLILMRLDPELAAAYERFTNDRGSNRPRRDKFGNTPAHLMEERQEILIAANGYLLRGLTEGAVVARGVCGDDVRASDIAPDDWTRLDEIDVMNDTILLPTGRGGSTPVRGVRVRTSDLVKILPSSIVHGTAGSEHKAKKMLSQLLRDDRDMKKPAAKRALAESGIDFTARGFDLRIWPEAREAAGLDARAKAGAPKRRSD